MPTLGHVRKISKEQLENIQTDYGLIYVNYGFPDQHRVGPTRGGGAFSATKTIRDIEYDGSLGKTKGMQVIDDIDAMLSVPVMDMSLQNIALAMPEAELVTEGEKTILKSGIGGIIPEEKYLKNITMFAKVIKGGYKRITLKNALSENNFSLSTAPKSEGVATLEVHAHWPGTSEEEFQIGDLYEIEDVEGIDPPPVE